MKEGELSEENSSDQTSWDATMSMEEGQNGESNDNGPRYIGPLTAA